MQNPISHVPDARKGSVSTTKESDSHISISEPTPDLLPSTFRRASVTRKLTPYPPATISNSPDASPDEQTESSDSCTVKEETSQKAVFTESPKKELPRHAKTVQLTHSPENTDMSVQTSIHHAPEDLGLKEVANENLSTGRVGVPEDIKEYIDKHRQPPIYPRYSSAQLQCTYGHPISIQSILRARELSLMSKSTGVDGAGDASERYSKDSDRLPDDAENPLQQGEVRDAEATTTAVRSAAPTQGVSLQSRRHLSLRGHHPFNLGKSHRRQPVARDWDDFRKRFVASIICLSTIVMGLVIGIYAGQVPAIQYSIVDFHHYSILGNVVLYLGLAISTFVFWPLPVLHGRKPYILTGLTTLLALQIPQAIAVTTTRSPYVSTFRVALLLPRAFSGLAMGFVQINLKATLLDLFGASLQSDNPHQEVVVEDDVRRHGGGMGVWLGIWTWCYLPSIGVGFLAGATIIDSLNPSWGFWITSILVSFALFLNVLTPEVRRAPHRRSVKQVKNGDDVSARIGRGEVMMHIHSTGPVWWGEEVGAGLTLSKRMLKQPGFAVIALYVGWIYGQVILVIVLLGALVSRYYRLNASLVGACVSAVPIGALLAVPFQKASFLSRARHHVPVSDAMTNQKRVTWSSHLVRRIFFTTALPFADLAYVLSSSGDRSTNVLVPTVFAGLIGFLSNLAIAECHGLIMETFDTSDLEPGTYSRQPQLDDLKLAAKDKRTNYSSFPRIGSAFAITQALGFVIAAIATAVGGTVERRIGTQTATAVVAAILLLLTILLSIVLWRSFHLPVVSHGHVRRAHRDKTTVGHRHDVRGTPSERVRRMNLLELGALSRWSEIRHLNGAAAK